MTNPKGQVKKAVKEAEEQIIEQVEEIQEQMEESEVTADLSDYFQHVIVVSHRFFGIAGSPVVFFARGKITFHHLGQAV